MIEFLAFAGPRPLEVVLELDDLGEPFVRGAAQHEALPPKAGLQGYLWLPKGDGDVLLSPRSQKVAERLTHWRMTSFLLVADIIGTGILSLPKQLSRLGWGFGIAMLCFFWPINLYSGILLKRVAVAFPSAPIAGYPDVAEHLWGKRAGNWSKWWA